MKILVVRVGRVGDLVMVTPALNVLLKKFPEAELHVLTSQDGKRVLKNYHSRLTEVILYNRKSLLPFLVRRKIRRYISDGGYAHIYCFETNPGYLKLFSGSPAQVHCIQPTNEVVHYSLRCLQVVDSSLREETPWVHLPVDEKGQKSAQSLLQENGIDDETVVVGFHPTFSGVKKTFFRSRRPDIHNLWPVESFGRLAELLDAYAQEKGFRLRIIIDLLAEESGVGRAVVKSSGDKVTLLTPPPDFERYKAMIQRMDLLVTPNTGPMHIAAAVGTSMVALFAGKVPEDCGPFMPRSDYVVLRAEETAHPQLGLAAISPDEVFEACKKFLH